MGFLLQIPEKDFRDFTNEEPNVKGRYKNDCIAALKSIQSLPIREYH